MTTEIDISFWRWRLGGVLLFIAAATHIVGMLALGQPPGPLAIASVVGVPLLALHVRRTEVTEPHG